MKQPLLKCVFFYGYIFFSVMFTILSLISPKYYPYRLRSSWTFAEFQTAVSEFQRSANQWLFAPDPVPFAHGTVCITRAQWREVSEIEDCDASYMDHICEKVLFASYLGSLSAQLDRQIARPDRPPYSLLIPGA